MHGYIYLTTDLTNGMRYIGKRTDTKFNPRYLGSGIRLKNAVRDHGRNNFDVTLLATAETKEELERLEKDIIEEHEAVTSERYYNLAPGGSGGKLYSDRSKHVIPHMERSRIRYSDLETILRTKTQREAATMLDVDQSAIAQRLRHHHLTVEPSCDLIERRKENRRRAASDARARKIEKNQEFWSRFDLAAMYAVMTQGEMAKIIGVSQVRVSQKLRELGISKK